MGDSPAKNLLVMVRRSPYGSSLARASIDAILAAAVFEQPVKLLFAGDGVLHLMPDQDSTAIGMRNSGRLLSSLPLYDLDKVYADGAAIERYAIDLHTAPVNAEVVDETGMRNLMDNCDHLLSF